MVWIVGIWVKTQVHWSPGQKRKKFGYIHAAATCQGVLDKEQTRRLFNIPVKWAWPHVTWAGAVPWVSLNASNADLR